MLPAENKKKISLVSLLPPKKYKLSTIRNLQPHNNNNSSSRKWSQMLALAPVYLLQICYGMNSGFPAILTPQLREDCSEFSITGDQESWIVSLDNLLTPVICLFSGPMQQTWGPRTSLMICCLPYFISWLLTSLATDHYLLYAARVLVGVSHALLSTTVYNIEVSSNEMRGTCSVLESVLRCFGCVLVYILGLFHRWKRIANFAIVIPVLALISCFFSPESPFYLVSKHRYKQAEASLRRLYGPEYKSRQQVLILSESLNKIQQKRRRKLEYLQNLRGHPELYKPFFIVIILSFVQQFSGVSVIRAYVVKIFDVVFSESGVVSINGNSSSPLCQEGDILVHKTSSLAYMSAITIGLFRLVASLALARLLLRFRRRNMYLVSLTLSIICLLTFSLFSYLAKDSPNTIYSWGSLVAACFLVFSVQLGVQTLPLLLSGELFPTDIRATCKGLTRSWTCVLLVVSLKLFPLVETGLTLPGTFLAFALILTLSFPVIFFILPETKDLSLDLIQQYFRANSVEEDPDPLGPVLP